MATYGQLLIDAGGGIVDRGRQSDRQDGASVMIGLGGTGADAVIKLKQEVYKQLRPDDAEAVIPRYEAIRYLIIDADDSQIEPLAAMTDIDKNTEFFALSNSSIKSTFEAKEILKTRRELYWLDYENISIDEASKGAGGIRQVGRFLLVDKGEALYAKMKSVIEGALTAAKSGELDIHICSGLSGGTGSGIFLDVCYLVRRILKQIGKQEARVSGYFFLPDVNLSVPVIQENPLISAYIKVNGYAALQELDYCMNFGKNKDSFRMNYGFAEVDSAMNPVDLCYLVSTTDASGNRVQNGYQYAMGVVTDYIISFLAKETSGFTLESHIANLNSMKEGIRVQHGANLDYNILGASVAEMPLTEIATYLGCELFEGYQELFLKVPAEKERDDFLTKMRLGYEDLQKEVSHGCVPSILFGKAYDVKMYEQGGRHPFEQRAEKYLSDNIGILERNAKTMTEGMEEFAVPKAGTSLISRTYKGLFDSFVTSMDYGPFYAGRLLSGGDNQNLIHAVDGFLKKNGELLEHELRQTRVREDEYQDASLKMENTNFLNKKTRMENYLQALTNLYAHHYRVELYKSMDLVLQEYKRQLRKMDQNLFRILMQVLETLRETFAVNKTVLSQKGTQDHLYAWKILSIPDVEEGLRQEFKEHDLAQTLYRLMMLLFEHCGAWINQDENEIRKLISDFILDEFHKATRRTMTDYLKEKFKVENPALLAEAVEKEIIRDKLGKDSTPLFWKNPMYKNSMGMHSYLTVPYDAAEMKMAAKNFINRQMEFTVRESHITDKLSMMRFYSGLPIFAYQGIMELQRAYEEDKKAGRHLFERGECNWNLLPPPVPDSFKVDLPLERLARRSHDLLEEFKRAEAAGVVVKDAFSNWNILKTAQLDVAAWIDELGGIQTNGKNNPKKIREAVEAVRQRLEQAMQEAEPVRIEYLNAVNGSERQVMLDFYLLAPVLQKLVRNELQKRENAQRKLASLEQLAQDTVNEKRMKNDFFNAVFTGVLAYGKKVVFHYDEFGIPKSIELSNSSMKYGQSGAYQAYLTYCTLDRAIREKIDSLTKALMDEEDSRQVQETVEALAEGMPKKIQGYLGIYDELDPVHEEMEAFYLDFMKTLHHFKLNM